MSDFGGFGGALLLSNQISDNRMIDGWNRARETSVLQLNDIAWRNTHNDLVNRYNALLADADKLCRNHDRAMEAMDTIVAAERAMKEAAEAENKKLRERLEAVEYQRSSLERYVRLHKPEYYDLLDLI